MVQKIFESQQWYYVYIEKIYEANIYNEIETKHLKTYGKVIIKLLKTFVNKKWKIQNSERSHTR